MAQYQRAGWHVIFLTSEKNMFDSVQHANLPLSVYLACEKACAEGFPAYIWPGLVFVYAPGRFCGEIHQELRAVGFRPSLRAPGLTLNLSGDEPFNMDLQC